MYIRPDARNIIATPNPTAMTTDTGRPSPQSKRQASPIHPVPMMNAITDSSENSVKEASVPESTSTSKSPMTSPNIASVRRSRNRIVPTSAIAE